MDKGAEKWSKHLDGYVSIDSPTPTKLRRSRITRGTQRALPPVDDPDKYPLYFIWDGAKIPCLLVLIGFVCAVFGFSVITVVNIATAYRTNLVKKFNSSDEIRWEWDNIEGYLSLSGVCVILCGHGYNGLLYYAKSLPLQLEVVAYLR